MDFRRAILKIQPRDRFTFNSWAFAQKPELHWQDGKHHSKVGTNGARFFVRLTSSDLIYGFCVRCFDDGGRGVADWRNFINWSERSKSHQTLLSMADEHELRVYDRNRPVSGIYTCSENEWCAEDGLKDKSLNLAELVELLSDHNDALFEVSRSIDKVDAIERGKGIVEDISKLFSQLFPLYAVSVIAH